MSSVFSLPAASAIGRSRTGTAAAYRPLRCVGEAVLPTPLAVDLARLLDVDEDVDRWSCRQASTGVSDRPGVVFDVHRATETEHLLASEHPDAGGDTRDRQPACGTGRVRVVTQDDIDPIRLENAKLILPYARWRVSIDDRVRLLAALDEEGSVTLGDCLAIFRNTTRPIAAVASLALARVVDLDLDTPLGSRSRVIRRPD
ncbi:hypothetical protein [Aureimonas sp. ME7]|uniref:hypothetical protein n=1 Tax=Aureimonas sp. ME7 TaxID=2744252 RepID=UPI0015F77554|nr:hypothetical protein [Aureimonas sp. ME7]